MNDTTVKPRGLFVTATDTGVGKTWVSVGLLQALQSRGCRAAGMKPVASGCKISASVLRNRDALRLRQASSTRVPYELVNPYRFAPSIAPHLAAERIGCTISLEEIHRAYRKISGLADFVVVEGVGGWRVPLNKEQDMADLVRTLKIPVLLVVGLRLGCINHALLSAHAIREDGAALLGWVISRMDPNYETAAETCDYLAGKLGEPPLAMVPHIPSGMVPELLAKHMKELARTVQNRLLE